MSSIDDHPRRGNQVSAGEQKVSNFTEADCIASFVPTMPTRYWEVIGAFVRDAVRDALPETPYTAYDLLSTVSRHVLWCWQTAGLDLNRSDIFDRRAIDEFISRGCPHLAPASRGNRRSQLLRVCEALLGSESSNVRLKALSSSEPVPPYSVAEMESLRSWAAGQATSTRRRDAATLLSLGAGAGLATEDISELTADMVVVDEAGVQLSVPGRRARLVPVLIEWEGPLIEAATSIPPGFPLFGERRKTSNKNFVTGFVQKSAGVGVKPSVQRLRSTWIVYHLAARTPIAILMDAAGVHSLEALGRYVRFVPPIDPAEAREALRGKRRHGS